MMKQGMPILTWLPRYRREWLRADFMAGITLAAYLIPGGLGDASLANLPPEAGLYACIFAGLIYWLFCSSRQTSITVTSAISLLVGASLGELAQGEAARFGALAAWTAMITGAVYFIGWLSKAGTVVNFVSETVLVGFKSGIAFFLASTQLPKLCGPGRAPPSRRLAPQRAQQPARPDEQEGDQQDQRDRALVAGADDERGQCLGHAEE